MSINHPIFVCVFGNLVLFNLNPKSWQSTSKNYKSVIKHINRSCSKHSSMSASLHLFMKRRPHLLVYSQRGCFVLCFSSSFSVCHEGKQSIPWRSCPTNSFLGRTALTLSSILGHELIPDAMWYILLNTKWVTKNWNIPCSNLQRGLVFIYFSWRIEYYVLVFQKLRQTASSGIMKGDAGKASWLASKRLYYKKHSTAIVKIYLDSH